MRPHDAQFMASRLFDYPYLAQAPTSVKPTLVPGDHCSARSRVGWRLWGFKTENERDTFVVQFGGVPYP
jgi:hypothetical protein